MNPTSIQNTRGTTADHASFAGLPGEISIDTDKNTAVVHDGSTLGGFPLARQSVANVMEFGAVGDGVADDAAAINAAIQSLSAGVVIFPLGKTFRIAASIVLKSGVSLVGNRAEIICAATLSPIVMLSGTTITDVEITGLIINGEGTWTATPFANPAGGGNSVGFTSGHFGARFTAASSNVSIRDCTFKGLTRGAVVVDSTQFSFVGNTLTTLGNSGIYSEDSSYGVISDNIVREVLGNMTAAGDTTVANSKYADGIYLHGSQSVTVTGNVVEDVKRIGIVLEGDGITLNSRVTIIGNTITNCNGSRGTEYNGAIWSENGKSDYTCTAQGNTLDNTGAAAGANQSWGLTGTYLTMTGNVVRGWTIGIVGTELRATGNTVEANQTGIAVPSQAAGLSTLISGNRIALNDYAGVHLYQSHGNITITDNLIEDNGQDPATYNRVCGVLVERYYNDQKVIIAHNTFISSAAEGDTDGQLAAIIGVGGGDFTRTVSYVSHNQFVFTGTFTTPQPAVGVKPCSFCYDDTTTLYVNELYPANELANVNGKFTQSSAGPVRNGSGSPSGVLTPQFLGEDYLDTSLNKWYKAYNYSNTGWIALN